MKPVEEVTACVIEYGTFIALAERLGQTMKKVYYYAPIEREYQNVRDCIMGKGLAHAERLYEFFDAEVFDDIDLFVFPDIGYGDLQRHLRSLGKAVWGHMGADQLELSRTHFLQVLEEVGLPVIHSEQIVGLTALAEYLKEHDNLHIKIDYYRANMETWHHINYKQSIRTLDSMAVIFGGAKESVVFTVQDHVESDIEVGYDGWSVDGQFPSHSFQGYEDKNELYLGSALADENLPEEVRIVNQAMAPVLAEYGYRGWWATEIRVKDGTPYFIDPTPRMPGQTGEHQLKSCTNLPKVIWHGANGELIPPRFKWKFACEATLHYKKNTKDPAIAEEWKTLSDVPPEVLPWTAFYHYCIIDGVYHFMGENTDEVGVVIGVGDSTEQAIDHLKRNLDMLKEQPVYAELAGFAGLLESIKEAEEQGITFGGRIPKPEAVLASLEA